MKKHRLYAVISAMVMALALVLAGCQQPSSGGSDSSGSGITLKMVFVKGGTVKGTEINFHVKQNKV